MCVYIVIVWTLVYSHKLYQNSTLFIPIVCLIYGITVIIYIYTVKYTCTLSTDN